MSGAVEWIFRDEYAKDELIVHLMGRVTDLEQQRDCWSAIISGTWVWTAMRGQR